MRTVDTYRKHVRQCKHVVVGGFGIMWCTDAICVLCGKEQDIDGWPEWYTHELPRTEENIERAQDASIRRRRIIDGEEEFNGEF